MEIGYAVLPLLLPDTEMALEPFYRIAYYDTQQDVPSGFSTDKNREVTVHTVDFSFKPIPNVNIKADYQNRDLGGGNLPDKFNIRIGFAF